MMMMIIMDISQAHVNRVVFIQVFLLVLIFIVFTAIRDVCDVYIKRFNNEFQWSVIINSAFNATVLKSYSS